VKEVLEKITPSREDYREMKDACARLLHAIESEASGIDEGVEALLVGSVSRDTWLNYEKDIDVFLRFPERFSKEELEDVVTGIGKRLLKMPEKRYAEHPYIKGEFEGHMVEIVPCYRIKDASELRSSVDRTPFHDEFVKKNLNDRRQEVRLLKQFLKGIGCYGAEAEVEGFSGYLCELLVIRYGSFEEVLKGASSWSYGTLLDLEGKKRHGEFEDSALVFIDPVDRERNVARALSEENFYRFAYAAKEFLKGQRFAFFFPEKRKFDREDLLERYRARGTALLALSFERPDVIEDILYPQLRKAEKLLLGLLKRNGFSVIGSDFRVSELVTLLFELESLEIPEAKLHLGPEVNSPHEERFLDKYREFEDKLCEPFIDGGRWHIFLKREHSSATALIQTFLKAEKLAERGMPSHIAKAIEMGFEIKKGEELFEKKDLALLAKYLDPRFPWEVN